MKFEITCTMLLSCRLRAVEIYDRCIFIQHSCGSRTKVACDAIQETLGAKYNAMYPAVVRSGRSISMK